MLMADVMGLLALALAVGGAVGLFAGYQVGRQVGQNEICDELREHLSDTAPEQFEWTESGVDERGFYTKKGQGPRLYSKGQP